MDNATHTHNKRKAFGIHNNFVFKVYKLYRDNAQ